MLLFYYEKGGGMTTLTIEFRGVTEDILKNLVDRGYAKTKTEAVRYALLHVGEEMKLTERKLHEKTEQYMEDEIIERFKRLKTR